MKYNNKNEGLKTILAHYFRVGFQLGYEKLCLPFFRIKCWWWGISCGSQISVCGLPKLRKTPGSSFQIGSGCRILSTFNSNLHGLNHPSMLSTLTSDARLSVGNSCGLSATIIACANSIEIGDRVMIGANCTISDTDSHSLDYQERNPQYYKMKKPGWKENINTAPVVIEDDAFIGMHTIILKGVVIGKGAVIGAGSVVVKSIPPNVIAAGNPAKVIRIIKE